ncbi:hypothetical protein OsI_30460 [Oryza sativa Indica Group]|uniref:Uncharacterized protein n=1 Tax=Oryza sativa subsp. indica TaxID=39946 RepID=A2YYN8_ORYSI|nr:hypothetical protein OsI_30460 [Oryza sativa Indica Group]
MTSQQLGCCWVLLIALLSCSAATASEVPAIIVFGDSTVDAGNNNYILTVAKGNFPPYGRDFDGGVATGRFSNGRLVTDFVSEALGLPSSVPAYLDSTYTIDQLATGVSFASSGTGLDSLTARVVESGKSIAEYIRGKENHGLHVGDYTIKARYNLYRDQDLKAWCEKRKTTIMAVGSKAAFLNILDDLV